MLVREVYVGSYFKQHCYAYVSTTPAVTICNTVSIDVKTRSLEYSTNGWFLCIQHHAGEGRINQHEGRSLHTKTPRNGKRA